MNTRETVLLDVFVGRATQVCGIQHGMHPGSGCQCDGREHVEFLESYSNLAPHFDALASLADFPQSFPILLTSQLLHRAEVVLAEL